MLTLKAAGLLDVDAGEILSPGILRIEGDRIVGVGGCPEGTEGEVVDLGDQVLLPGLMDMEVNLLMGGPGEKPGLSQVQDDPPTRMLRAVGNARRTLRAGLTVLGHPRRVYPITGYERRHPTFGGRPLKRARGSAALILCRDFRA